VRYYTTKPTDDGVTFKCTFCEYSVTTLDFSSEGGNRRTQAATAINQHVSAAHGLPLPVLVPTKLGSRGAL
jgi:hypothetical protein